MKESGRWEIEGFTKEKGIDLTIAQKQQVLEMINVIAAMGEELSPVINELQACDPEVIYAIIVLMPITSLDHILLRHTNDFKASVDKVFAFLREKKERDQIEATLGSGI